MRRRGEGGRREQRGDEQRAKGWTGHVTLLSFDGRSADTRSSHDVITGASLSDVWPEVSTRLGRLLTSRGASRDVADDLVQEVAARALAREVVFADAADLMRWAVPVALNLLVDNARSAGRVTVGIDGWDAAEGDVADLVAHRDRLNRVLGAVARLSAADREALTAAEDAPSDRREAVKLAVRRHRARRRLLALVDGVAGLAGVLGWIGVWARRARPGRSVAVAALPVAFVLPVALVLVNPAPEAAPERAIAMAPAPRVAVPVTVSRPLPATAARPAVAVRPARATRVVAPKTPTVVEDDAPAPRAPSDVVKVGPKGNEVVVTGRPRNANDRLVCIYDPLPVVGAPCVG